MKVLIIKEELQKKLYKRGELDFNFKYMNLGFNKFISLISTGGKIYE